VTKNVNIGKQRKTIKREFIIIMTTIWYSFILCNRAYQNKEHPVFIGSSTIFKTYNSKTQAFLTIQKFLRPETWLIHPQSPRRSTITTMGGKRRHQQLKQQKQEDLDRFAGSSEEEHDESSSESEGENDQEEQQVKEVARPRKRSKEQEASRQEEEEDDDDDQQRQQEDNEDDSDDVPVDDDDDDMVVASGMAAAMSKILGTSSTKKSPTVVLSKTTTPLQRMALKEKQQEKEQREKRRANRERNLTALHIPLSVATSNSVGGAGQAVAAELEQERTHRRVATRGVVALFNAIAQHQKKQQEVCKVLLVDFSGGVSWSHSRFTLSYCRHSHQHQKAIPNSNKSKNFLSMAF
jgi:hypothetical protein